MRIKLVFIQGINLRDEQSDIRNLLNAIANKDLTYNNGLAEEIIKRKPVLSIYIYSSEEEEISQEMMRTASELCKAKIAASKNVYLNNF